MAYIIAFLLPTVILVAFIPERLIKQMYYLEKKESLKSIRLFGCVSHC